MANFSNVSRISSGRMPGGTAQVTRSVTRLSRMKAGWSIPPLAVHGTLTTITVREFATLIVGWRILRPKRQRHGFEARMKWLSTT